MEATTTMEVESIQVSPKPPPPLSISQRMLILKALGDSRRLEIMERLSASETAVACSELREMLPICAATLSHHLKELETAGLIRSERDGKFAMLTLRRDVWQTFLTAMQQL